MESTKEDMTMTTRLTIAQSERALLWRQGRFVGILEPGVRWILQPFACIAVQLYDLNVPEFDHPRMDELQTAVSAAVMSGAERGEDVVITYERARTLADDCTGAPQRRVDMARLDPQRARPPHLTEPWFC